MTAIQKIKSFGYYAEAYLKIKNKASAIVPFEFNKAQLVIERVREWVRANGFLERYIILKARQKGISTYWEADLDHSTSTEFNVKAAVIGHEDGASKNLFEMVKRFYKHKPDAIKPQVQNTNEQKLKYSALDSEIKVKTAGLSGEGVGRSDTINKLHATEVGFWNKLKETLLALLQCVPDEPNTLIVLESTANGLGNDYHTRWQEVYTASDRIEIIPNVAWKSATSNFVAIFISWLIDDEYTKQFESPEARALFETTLTKIEISLIGRGATLEHLLWRRFAVKDKCGSDEGVFAQEYPSTPEEAFLVSGRPVFDRDLLQHNLAIAEQREYTQGDLIPVYDKTEQYYAQLKSENHSYYDLLPFLKGVEFIENSRGFIKIYKQFEIADNEYNRFASGWDVSEGLEQGDFSSGSYLDRKDMELLLTWHGHIDPDLLAEEQHKISVYLEHKDFVCTERNNHGLTTITGAWKLRVMQYYQKVFGEGYPDTKDLLGFRTTQQTKPIIINDLNEYIREDLYKEWDKDAINEMLTFVKNVKGQMQAQGKDKDPATKCFDDRVIDRALMVHCHKWMPNYYVPPSEPAKLSGRQEAASNTGEINYAKY
jgi:hypothetical protein